MELSKSDFFFCYNKNVSSFLKSKGIHYLLKAKHPASDQIFTLYHKDSSLQTALDDYVESKT